MAENSETDWILIKSQVQGKCVGCGQVITSGRALWSKSTKTIKHQDCSLGKANQPSNNEEKASNNQEMSTHKKQLKMNMILTNTTI
jgi:hypothetical protein